ncbi:hypothetical protein [Brachybacterium sp. ACRRE]|uniref:hypothetical protein n=1 Tax=Brachybacterium sp. ACRRE TaxID=2918184 RepID=UPI001EF1B5D3|nr:hypothetical protein [Brachybacterium sp. ACRRE]MCG7308007.1 hypothetical protein [Brachybacterium sp. ACRRE]
MTHPAGGVPELAAPGPVPDKVTEPAFTAALGRFFSATRGQADQRDLRLLVAKALADSTSSSSSLGARWVEGDSWHWGLNGPPAPDVVATDDDDTLALVMKVKGAWAKLNATSAKAARHARNKSEARLDQWERVMDARSAEIFNLAVPQNPAWDTPHLFEQCRAAQEECAWHTGSGRAGVHQGDAYASLISYLPDGVTIPEPGLDAVDFIALLPRTASARAWGQHLVSADRWHVASVGDFLARLDDGRRRLASSQTAWLDHLLGMARVHYGDVRLAELSDIERAYDDARRS